MKEYKKPEVNVEAISTEDVAEGSGAGGGKTPLPDVNV